MERKQEDTRYLLYQVRARRYNFRITDAPDLIPVLREACLHLKLPNWIALETVGPLVIYERGISDIYTDPRYSKCLFGEVLAR